MSEIVREIVGYGMEFLEKMKRDAVSAYAAQGAFFIVVSFFPFVMLLLTLIRYLPLTEEMLIQIVQNSIPPVLGSYVVSLIEEIYRQPSAAIISLTVVASIWSASKAFLSIIQGCNSVYGIYETRNYVVLRLLASLYTIVFAVMIAALLVFMVFGNRIADMVVSHFPVLRETAILIISLRTAVSFGLLALLFLILYVVVPNRKGKVLRELPGALAASAGWIGFSYLYSFYIDHFANFDTYGSLTVIVFLMLWLYACMYMFLVGGEINVFLQGLPGRRAARERERGKG